MLIVINVVTRVVRTSLYKENVLTIKPTSRCFLVGSWSLFKNLEIFAYIQIYKTTRSDILLCFAHFMYI